MDFHALPRRDLQALCKRNGIRANMTNVAMADALASLPAVIDGIEKEAAAEEGEMQGISLPGGHGAAVTPHEVIMLGDSEEEDKDLMPNQDEEKAAALGVGRRRAGRRSRVEPVATPATRKRAAASMAETAAEAVPARTTRARSQRMVVSAPEEEAPKATRTPRRAVARKTSTEQEEEEKGTQGDVADGCVVDSSGEEGQTDVQQAEEEIHHGSEDTEMVPVNEVPLAMLKSGEAAEEVDFTSDASGENEIPTSGEMLQSAAKAIEEKEDMAADEMTNNTDMSVEEEAAVATDEMPQRSSTVEQGVIEVVTIDNLSQATITDDEGVFKESSFTTDLADVSTEAEAAAATDEMPLSLATMDESVQEEEVPVDFLSQATVTDDEGAVKESGFSWDPNGVSIEKKKVVAADGMPQSLARPHESVEQVATIENLSQATLTDDEGAVKESGFNYDIADVSLEEDGVVTADDMSQRSATLDESVKEEVATIDNLSQVTVADDEWVAKESTFAGDRPLVADTAREISDRVASPLTTGMLETATKLSIDSITVEPMMSEADDVPLRMHSNSGGQNNVAEPVAVEREKESKECEELGSLSLRKLRIKLKEKVAVEREKEMKEGKACEALGSLSLRKLRTKLKEKVAVAQENEVKEGKESTATDKLSLRKLKMKIKETLNAQKVISKSQPSIY